MVTKTCGIDWSEGQQDVAIVDEQARVLARTRVAEDVAGLSQLLALLAEHANGEPASIDIAIETDKGLLVTALVAAGSRYSRSIPGPQPATASATRKRAGNPTAVMRSCWPISCVPIATPTGRCRLIASWPARSR